MFHTYLTPFLSHLPYYQVKEILGQQDSQEAGEHAGPLDEIDFWRARSVDLSGIRT